MARTTRHLLFASFLVVLAACGGDDTDDTIAVGATTEETTATGSDAEGSDAEGSDAEGSDAEGSGAEGSDAEGSGGSEGASAPGEVAIADFTFVPEDITVSAGTTVTWTNEDEAAHSVADRELDFESGNLAEGDTFEFTYDEAGEFPYVCGIHNYMRGTVTVE